MRGSLFAARLFPLLLLLPVSSAAQIAKDNSPQLIHGSIVTAQGQLVAGARVEIRDLDETRIGLGFTNSAGRFEISTVAEPGEYVVLAAKELQTRAERVTLGPSDLEIRIALPSPSEAVAPEPSRYTVSATQLSVPAKAGKHLKSAQKHFSKMDLPGAIQEIDRALEIDPLCAQAFSMRAFVRLAANDFSAAIEDAVRAAALDSHEADSYIALAIAYNHMKGFEKAAEAARQAISIRPDAWQGRLEMAKSLYGQDQYVLALGALDLVNKDFPDVHLVRADVLMRLGRSREAAEQFVLFLRQAPHDSRGVEIRQIVANVGKTSVETNLSQR